MSLGAAGCRYTEKDCYCAFMCIDVFCKYYCIKFKQELKEHTKYKEPIRCKECEEEADKKIFEILMNRRKK